MDYLYALQTLRESAPEFVNYFFLAVSEIFLRGGVIVAAVIYWCVDKSAGATITLGYCASYSVNQLVKNIACVYRPWIKDSRLHVDPLAASSATGYSFPSGHTVTATTIFGGMALWQRKRKILAVVLALVAVLVAFSRNWLGAHTIQDVLVAMCIAVIGLCVVSFLKKYVQGHPSSDIIICAVGSALSVLILVILSLKKYPLDYDEAGNLLADPYAMLTDCYTACGMTIGGLLGWVLERRFVRFSTQTLSKLVSIVRGTVGVVLFGLIYLGFGTVFSFTGPHWVHFIKYFAVIFFTIYLYPLIFTAVENRR